MNKKIGIVSRVLLLLCALGLIAVIFLPMWRIDLVAPQYPEGLRLLIYPNKLGGNVDIVNGLNHYIGMKTLHAEDFIEFTVLPYILGFYLLLFLVAAIVGRKKVLYWVFAAFLLFCVVAMVDFWKWEYNYGHNLDPNAAIIVPGMSYQPPLIGYKQLLNFSAFSIPDTGGWIFIGVAALALACVVLEWRSSRKWKLKNKTAMTTAAAMLLLMLVSCNTSPEPIKVGTDNCTFCKMTVSDARYGAEIVTKKGKTFKFDDAHCVLAYLKNLTDEKEISDIYFTDFDGKHELIKAGNALFFQSDQLNSPMGGNVAAFSDKDGLLKLSQQFKGTELTWNDLKK